MMKTKLIPVLALLFLTRLPAGAQHLQAGFDGREYLDALAIAFGRYDSVTKAQQRPSLYRFHYRSAVTGLDNRWVMWLRQDRPQAVISVRGTVATTASWLANIYSVMQPAAGSIRLNDSTTFRYRVADHPAAEVHTGWLLSLGFLAPDIERKIREHYGRGIKDLLLVGHSQGAGITFLLRAYLYYRIREGALPADLVIKTYCSAAPKPGNLYFAYDYDFINRNGWSYTVVNAADWVPETPVSIQQLNDLNPLNPFVDVKSVLRKQKYFIRLYGGLVYRKLSGSTRKAAAQYRKYLGRQVSRQVAKKLPQLQALPTTGSLNYVRTGTQVVLLPDAAYYRQFPDDPRQKLGIWGHHTFEAYDWLTRKDYLR